MKTNIYFIRYIMLAAFILLSIIALLTGALLVGAGVGFLVPWTVNVAYKKLSGKDGFGEGDPGFHARTEHYDVHLD